MTADGRHIAWLRAQIAGQEAAMRQVMNELARSGDTDPLALLINRAFVIAVRGAFGAEFSRGEVIRLVAGVRAQLSKDSGLVDPVAAESEIRRALGESAPLFPDPDARAAAQLAVLDYLVRDLGLSDDQVSSLLDQARHYSLPACVQDDPAYWT